MQKTLDLFADFTQPCQHCGGNGCLVFFEESFFGQLHKLICDTCTYETHESYTGLVGNQDFSFVMRRWNSGMPSEVHNSGKQLTIAEYYRFWHEKQPVWRTPLINAGEPVRDYRRTSSIPDLNR